jgi:hypothetical protein
MRMSFPFRRAKVPEEAAGDSAGWTGPPALAGRACCCPARPVVRVLIPPAFGRPHTVDLLLCGHHYVASRFALAKVGAAVIDETGAVVESASASIEARGVAAGAAPQ